MEILNKPLADFFFDCVRNAHKSIKLCSPFIKNQAVTKLLEHKNSSASVNLITKINTENFYKKASDITALDQLAENKAVIYNCQCLHAKIYIFDDSHLIITSANLTKSGLNTNFEYGVHITEPALIKQACSDYKKLCSGELSSPYSNKQLQEIKTFLASLPKWESDKLPAFDFEQADPVDALIDKSLLESSPYLSSWKRDVFEALQAISKNTFSTQDYLPAIPALKEKYPRNNNVEAKVRQILQQLRDIGLLKFEGNGVYTKLWK